MSTNSKTLKFVAGMTFALALVLGSSASAAITSQLKLGSRNSKVLELQQFLNNCSAETKVASVGAGSPGMETSYFGPATKRAVIAFQTKMGIATTSYSAGLVGPATRAAITAGCGTSSNPSNPSNPVSNGPVSAMLAATNPASSTLVAGSAAADLAHFAFSNGTAAPVKVSNVTLMRNGISVDTTLSNVFLYSGVNRLTDSATVSNGVITFNDPTGLFTIPANGSIVISVRSDIASGVSGQTVGVTLTAFNVVGATTSTTVSVMGNLHATATVSGMATLDFNTTTTPSSSTVDPQSDYVMWQNVVTVGNRDAWLKSFRLRQIGSVTTTDLTNFRLYIDGMMVGTAVPYLDSMGYITFDLSATPVKLLTGGRTIKVLGDITGGSSRTFSFSLRQASDAWVIDSQLGTSILATANSNSFSARSSTSATINSGTLSIVKQSNTPSGNTVLSASGVVLAKYDVKAYGETMKIENLSFRIDEDDTDTAYTLRNGAIYLDGVQIGSTAAIAADNDATQAYTNFTFGSAALITPGTTRVLEVRGDIYDNDGSNGVVDADTIQVEIVAGSSNVQRMTSLTYGSYPAAAVEGGILTVSTGSLTVAKDTSYADNTTTVPKTAYLLGKYNIQANTTEGANITSIVVDFDEVADAFDASDDVTNLWLKIGGSTTGAGGIKSTVTDTANTFSTNVNINAGQTISVEVYGDLASTAGDAGTADTGESSITVSYTTTGGSSTSTTASEVDGQTVTFGSGTFTSATDGSSPLNRIVAGNQEVVAAVFKFTAANETYTIKELQAKVGSAAIGSTVSMVNFYDGATLIGSASLAQSSNTAALITGLNVPVTANTSKLITVKLMLNTIGTNAGTSQSNASVTLDSVKYADSQGSETTSTTDRTSNELYVYKSVPTVTHSDLVNTSSLVNGSAQELYKFTVSASSQGAIALKQFYLTTAWTDGGTADTLEVESVKLFEDGVDVTANVVIQDEDGNSVESTSGLLEIDDSLTVSWATGLESVIPAGGSKTYVVKGTPSGFRLTGADTVGDSVSFVLNADTAHNGTKMFVNGTSTAATLWGLHTSAAATGSGTLYQFIWSDNSSNVHVSTENATSTTDWANGYKVLNLDLNGETWTK